MRDIPFRGLVGFHRYIVDNSRPDAGVAVGELSRFLSDPGDKAWKLAKRVLRFLKATRTDGLLYDASTVINEQGEFVLSAYADASFASDPDKGRSRGGYMIFIGKCLVAWKTRLQTMVAPSTMAAEYVEMGNSVEEVRHMRMILESLGEKVAAPVILYEDNEPAICLAKDPVNKGRAIDVKWHLTRQAQDRGEIVITKCPSVDMIADMMTKALAKEALYKLRYAAGMRTFVDST
jgi:hypothetical protein